MSDKEVPFTTRPRKNQRAYELTEKQLKFLNETYFDKKIMVGRDKLYQYTQQNYNNKVPKPERLSRRGIQKWLNTLEVNQLFAPKKKRKTIKRTVLSAPFDQIAIDLIDMSNHKKKKWILTGYDLFSKRGYAYPLVLNCGRWQSRIPLKERRHRSPMSCCASTRSSSITTTNCTSRLLIHPKRPVKSLPPVHPDHRYANTQDVYCSPSCSDAH